MMMSDGDSVELELEGSALSLEGKPRGTSRRGSCAAAELWISSARYSQGFPQAVDNFPLEGTVIVERGDWPQRTGSPRVHPVGAAQRLPTYW